jgi:hypothetical protein
MIQKKNDFFFFFSFSLKLFFNKKYIYLQERCIELAKEMVNYVTKKEEKNKLFLTRNLVKKRKKSFIMMLIMNCEYIHSLNLMHLCLVLMMMM